MNEKKIAFIICCNNERYMEECEYYIDSLVVPGGFTKEVKVIRGAKSMCAGYNEGMRLTDAAYKVYMHQDVFIHDADFITKVIRAFEGEGAPGLIGVIGTADVPLSGLAYKSWDLGSVIVDNGSQTLTVKGEDCSGAERVLAKAVDGMLMVTRTDIEWREDLFTGFDYYDISQCCEFIRAGHTVGILSPDAPLCLHDCGISRLADYERNRRVFCGEYKDLGFEYDREILLPEETRLIHSQYDEITSKLKQVIDAGMMDAATDTILKIDDRVTAIHNGVTTLYNLAAVHRAEQNAGTPRFYEKGMGADELISKFTHIKFLLRRVAFGIEEDKNQREIDDLIGSGKISEAGLNMIAAHHTP